MSVREVSLKDTRSFNCKTLGTAGQGD